MAEEKKKKMEPLLCQMRQWIGRKITVNDFKFVIGMPTCIRFQRDKANTGSHKTSPAMPSANWPIARYNNESCSAGASSAVTSAASITIVNDCIEATTPRINASNCERSMETADIKQDAKPLRVFKSNAAANEPRQSTLRQASPRTAYG